MTAIKHCIITLMILVSISAAAAGSITDNSFKGVVTKEVNLKYTIFLPDSYEETGKQKKWPTILFLHGAGERGDDINKIKNMGPLGYAQKTSGFGFIVVAPQCPLGRQWEPDSLIALLDNVQLNYHIDPDRVYLTGYSMGGAGTWALAMDHSDRFAAIAPLCGRVIPLLCGNLWQKPVWVFHGEKDDVVPFSQSQEIVGFLKGMGNEKVKFTTYPDMGHEIWYTVYSNPELYKWFLSNKREAESK